MVGDADLVDHYDADAMDVYGAGGDGDDDGHDDEVDGDVGGDDDDDRDSDDG